MTPRLASILPGIESPRIRTAVRRSASHCGVLQDGDGEPFITPHPAMYAASILTKVAKLALTCPSGWTCDNRDPSLYILHIGASDAIPIFNTKHEPRTTSWVRKG